MVLARKDGIAHWRRVLGPTKVSEALKKSPNSIRATFGDPHRCVMSISALKKMSQPKIWIRNNLNFLEASNFWTNL